MNGGSLVDAAGNTANLTMTGYTGDGVLIDSTAPVVTSAGTPDAGAYHAGQALSFNVYWSEPVTVTGTPQIALTIGGTTVQAVYQSWNSTTMRSFFAYTIGSGDTDSDGITAGALTLSGGTIKDAAGNAAVLTLPALDTSRILVDTTAPTVSAITRVGSTPTLASSVQFQVTFSEAVTGVTAANFTATSTGLTGTPAITSLADGGTVGSCDTFIVTVSGYSGTGSLRLDKTSNTGIQDLAANAMASANFTAGEAYAVDNTPPAAATIDLPAAKTYTTKTGNSTLSFDLNWSEAVTVSGGTPRLALSVGAFTRYADYASGSGTSKLTFTYTVSSADQDTDGILIAELDRNGASIADAAGNPAGLTLPAADASGVKIQGTYALTLLSSGGGMGDLTVSPAQASFADGTTVTLTSTPGSNSLTVGASGGLTWTPDDPGTPAYYTASLLMDGDKTITAYYELKGAAYVDPTYDSNTPGWGITRFASIQTAITSVTAGTLLNVSGSFTENVNLNKNLNLVLLNNTVINGSITQSDGVFDAPGGMLTLRDGYTKTGGTFKNNGGTIQLTGSAATISGGMAFASLEVAVGAGNTLTADAITLSGALTVTSGTFSPATGTQLGDVTVASGATLKAPLSGTLAVAGNWTNNGAFTENGAAVTFNGAAAQSLGGSSPLSFSALQIASSGTVSTAKALTVTGALTVTSGTINPYNGSSFASLAVGPAGAFGLSTGAAVSVTGAVDNQGSFAPAGGTLNVGGLFTNSGSYDQTGGTVNANAGFTNTGTFAQTGGTLAVTGAFSNSGTFAQEGGALTVSTTFSNSGTFAQSSGTLTVTAGFTNTAAGSYSQTGGTTSAASFANAGSFAQSGGSLSLTGAFTNTGSYAQSGTGTVTVGGNFNNSEPGSFSAAGGTLNLAGNLSHTSTTGAFAATGGTVNFNGASAQSITGDVSFASLNLNNPAGVSTSGSLSVAQDFTLSQGAFSAPAAADFNNISIASGATLTAPAGGMTVSGNFANAGTFVPNGGTVTFDGPADQAVTGASLTTFANLIVNKAAGALSSSAALTVTGSTTVSAGAFAPASASQFNSLSLASGAAFTAPSGNISLSGDFTNDGTFDAGTGTLIFNGSGAQVIGGANAAHFNNLTINNSSSTAAVSVAPGTPAPVVAGLLNILDGTFTAPDGTDLNSVSVASGAVFNAPAGSLTVSGGFYNGGTFNANGGTVTFDGATAQAVTGATSFYNVVVANTAAAPDGVSASSPVTVANNLSVNDGVFQPGNGSSFKNVAIGADGEIYGATAAISVSGDWTNAGTFTPAGGKVTFNGSAGQTIGGTSATNFYDLTINNTSSTGAVAYAAGTPAPAVANTLSLLDGTFQPPSGTDLNIVSIASGAVFDAPASGALTISGNITNDGTFNANNSTVTIDGAGSTLLSGASTTTFANLVVTKMFTSLTPLAVTGSTSVTGGVFSPASGSDLNSISIANGAVLVTPPGDLTVSGDLANNGTFSSVGTVIFDGASAQTISGTSATNFLNLTVNNSGVGSAGVVKYAAGTPAPAVYGTLSLLDGAFQPPAGTDLNTVSIASGAVLDAPSGNLTVSGNFANSGAFNANGGTVTFDGAADQAMSGTSATTFANLAVNKSAGTLSSSNPLTVTGSTAVDAGAFAPAAGSDFAAISIASGASFTAPAGNISVSGDFANAGTFTPGTGTVTFDGAAAQSISGAASFYDLVIANTAAAPAGVSSSAAVSAAHSLAVNAGIFAPFTGSSFGNVAVGAAGTLDGSGGTLSVGGNWTNAGSFTPGTGTVIFNGASGDQTIGGANATNFNNLTINNSGTGAIKYASGTPAPAVAGLLALLDGAFQPPSGADLNNVSIASGAVLTAPAGSLTVAGDFTNNGAFNANGGTVTFDGGGPQVLSGSQTTVFQSLVVDKPGGVLTASSPITVSGPAAVTSGGFDPFSGSAFNSLSVGQNGSFVMSSPGVVTVTNAVTNAGVFAPSNGTLNALGGFTNTATGSFEPAGGVLNVTGSFTNAGEYAALGGTTNVSGGFTNSGSITSSGGILDIGGSLTNSGSYLASGGALNLAGNLSNTGSFHPTGGTVVFDGTSGQTFTGNAPTFASLTVNNTSLAGVSIVPPMTVTDLLTVAGGKFNPPSDSQFTDILINAAGTLILDSTDTIKVAGDFTNDGAFTSKNSTVVLNGSGDQTIGGSKPVTFRNLEVANTGASSVVDTSAAVTVTGNLTLTDGVFQPADGSEFANVTIQPNGTFSLANNAGVTVFNSLVNNGTFAPQNGLLDLWGDFTNNGAFSPSGGSVNVGGDFLNYGTYAASGGTVTVIADFVNAANAHFTSTGGSLDLNGDLFNNGDFHPTGASSVAFIGALEQSISGLNVPTFANLLLDNPAGVVPHTPIDVQGLFDLNQGSFTPTTGSSFADMLIGAGTSLILSPGSEISASGDITNNGTFNASAGTVTLDGAAAQVLNGANPFVFGDLVVDNSGTGSVSSLLPLTVLGDLTVSDGILLATSGSTFNNVSTAPGAVLDGSAGPLTVTGDWNGLGSFIAGSSTVTFAGAPPQTFAGSNVFNNLVVADGAVLEMAANANLGLNGALTLQGSGDLDTSTHEPNTLTLTGTTPQTLPAGLDLSSLVIDPGATFLAPAGNLSISGDFTNNGGFTPGSGTVTFDGAGDQAITGSGPTTFNNLVIANSGAGEVTTNPGVTVTGSLDITDGVFTPATGSDFNDVTIGANGTLDGSGGTLNVGGDWVNNGAFDPGTGTVVFDGGSGQTIGGSEPTTFNNLVIDNPAGVVDTTPITVTNDLTVDPGAVFTPADGSTFTDVTIGSGGELIVPPGADITVTGDYINNGGTSDLYTLTVLTAGDGTGTADYLPAGGAFVKGTKLTLTAAAGSHSGFTGWSGGGLSGSAAAVEITLDANTTVTATFDVLRFSLSVNTNGAGTGTVGANPAPEIATGKYKYGEVVTLTPNAATGSVFTGWSGSLSGWANPATVTITEDTAVTANFRPDDQNQAPTFTSTPVEAAGKGFIYTYHVATSDSNGDQVAVSFVDKPAWLNLVDNGDGTASLQGIPPAPGHYTVTLEVRDALGGVTQQTYTLTVEYHIMFILVFR